MVGLEKFQSRTGDSAERVAVFPAPSRPARAPRVVWATAILIIALPTVLLLPVDHRAALYLLGAAFGAAYQRSRICFAGAIRDPFLFHQTRSARAVLIMVTVGSAGVLLLRHTGPAGLPIGNVYPVGLHTVLGAVLFGIGMVIAGACVCGSVAQAGQGLVLALVTLASVYLGFRLGTWQFPWELNATWQGFTLDLAEELGNIGIVLHFSTLVALYAWLERLERSSVQ